MMQEWREAMLRRQAVRRLPLEEKRRLAFMTLDPDAKMSPQVLEHAVVLAESLTDTGAFDLDSMPEASRKVLEPVLVNRGATIVGRSEGHPRPTGDDSKPKG